MPHLNSVRKLELTARIDRYSEFNLKAYRDNIPLGMFLSAEENAKKSWHPLGMPLLGASRGDADMGERMFFYRETHP